MARRIDSTASCQRSSSRLSPGAKKKPDEKHIAKGLPMPTTDPRIDAYIAKSADFAKPILRHIRGLVHAGCPNVVETMKWSFPHFEHHGVMCGMAAFKQ